MKKPTKRQRISQIKNQLRDIESAIANGTGDYHRQMDCKQELKKELQELEGEK